MIAAVSRTEPPEMSACMNDMLSRTSRIDTTVAPRRRTRIPIRRARRYHRPMTAGCPTRLPDVVDRPHCLDEREGRVKRNRGALDVAVDDAAWGRLIERELRRSEGSLPCPLEPRQIGQEREVASGRKPFEASREGLAAAEQSPGHRRMVAHISVKCVAIGSVIHEAAPAGKLARMALIKDINRDRSGASEGPWPCRHLLSKRQSLRYHCRGEGDEFRIVD
jgi:hypothetical protein